MHWRGIIASGVLHAAAIGIVSANVMPTREPPVEDVPSIAVELMLDIESSPVAPMEPANDLSVPEPPDAAAAAPEVETEETTTGSEPLDSRTPLSEPLVSSAPVDEVVSVPRTIAVPPAAPLVKSSGTRKVEHQKPPQRAAAKPAKANKKSAVSKKKASQQAALASGKGSAGNTRSTGGAATEASFKSKVLARLRAAKRYPEAARQKGMEGVTVLAFSINSAGRLTSARIVKGSGHAVLDKATLAMARNAAPFPVIPAGLGRSQMTFRVPVQFKVD